MKNLLLISMRSAILLVSLLAITICLLPVSQSAGRKTRSHSVDSQSATIADKGRVRAAVENMPLQFIENRGQLDPGVAYYVQGSNTQVYFGSEGVTLILNQDNEAPASDAHRYTESPLPGATPSLPANISRKAWSLKLGFVGANRNVRPNGQDPTPTTVSYFKGRQDKWRTGLATYGSVIYEDLWPGIDLIYSGDREQLKYTLVVKPGADPDQIKFAYRGAQALLLTAAGELDVQTPIGSFHDQKPRSYQDKGGTRNEVPTTYLLEQSADMDQQVYGFRIGAYDTAQPLLIDPAIVVYAGYLGGDRDECALGIAVDNAGNAYITGETSSTALTFPITAGPILTTAGGQEAFVAKLNPAGTAFIYCSYLGGSGDDVGFAVAADSSGNAYVVGATSSTEASFPVNLGPDLTYNGGAFDAFVVKVNPNGTALVYCGYIGGAGADGGAGVAVDGSGNAYVTGATSSSEGTFPVSIGPDLTYNGGLLFGDAFVAKVAPAGNGLVYCGFIGGAGEDVPTGIAVDANGNTYVSGGTNSPETSFPVRVGPDLTYNGGVRDGWVAKVNSSGSSLVYCGYIGGSRADMAYDIAVDNAGNGYVAGETGSTEATFPVRVGPDMTYNGGSFDGFVAKVNAAGSELVYAGYIGGLGRDGATGIAIDGAGNVYVTGASHSSESSFPVRGGPDLTFNGGSFSGDAFVAKVNGAGTTLDYCGYIGGADDDAGYGIAVDNSGNAYVVGETSSTQLSFPAIGGPDLTYNGGIRDGFVAKIVENQDVVAIQAAQIWLGLKNSDDVGTKFDLLAEVFQNGSVIGTGQINDVPGGSSGFNNAVKRSINLSLAAAVNQPGSTLSLRLSVRIAASSSHRSGTARLWFNDSAANSGLAATFEGVTNNYFLRSSFGLASIVGPGPKNTIDVPVDRNVGGNPFKPFGTWTMTF